MHKSQLHLLLAILNVIGFLGVVAVNGLANALPLAGKTTGQLSDQYPNLFVPSGLTFSIWGLIYLLLAIYVTYGMVQAIRMPAEATSFISRIGVLFLITCIANAAWIFCWHYELLPLSLLCMVILLVTLIAIYLRLNVGRSATGPAEKFLVHLPISIYLGWISIATIANVTALLVEYKWNRFGISEQVWAALMIGIGTVLALLVLFQRKDLFYALVVDWAVLGILIKRASVNRSSAQGIIITSIICISTITIAVLIQIIRGKVYS
jgi:hypothetical protein